MSLTFLAPQFLWALLALPLVVLLHFIRARKLRRPVSALFLWRRAFELAQARRRLSPTWLLLLQLLFVALAALALAQPGLTLRSAPDRVLVIDASASMAARDGDGVRIEKALATAEELLAGGGRVAIVRAGLDATVAHPPSTERGSLRAVLRNLEATDREADLQRALALAGAIAPEAEIHLLTDRPLPAGAGFTYHPVAGDGVNLGISTFDIGLRQAYVAVVSTSIRPQEVTVELLLGGEPLARTPLLIPAAGQANAIFPLESGDGVYQVRLDAPAWDALALDDEAFAGSRELVVVLDGASVPLQRALEAIPGVRWRTTGVARRVPADVRILTQDTLAAGVEPTALDPGDYLLFAPPSEEASFRTIRDWDQGSTLLRFVDLRETVVGIHPDWPIGPETEQPGWQVLARTGDLTPVLRYFEGGGRRIVQAAFHPSQTDMVFRPAFPALMANILARFRGEERLALGSPLPPGTTRGDAPAAVADRPGVYEIDGRFLSASLLSAAESRIPGPVEVPADGDGLPGEPAEQIERRRSAAPWLIFLGLLVLLAEWFLWSRARGGWVATRG